ncbi:sensor histidine kinase [Virgibacillus oceani]|nr:sensor histidine kinase [Virgibacillus oceani]
MRKKFPRELMTLVLPFIYLLFGPFNQAWFVNMLLFLVLAASFWQGLEHSKYRQIFIVIQLVSVSLMGALYSPWSLVMGFYPALVMGMLPSKRHITRMVGLMAAFFAVALFYFYQLSHVPWRFEWVPLVIVPMILPYVSKAIQHSVEVSMKLKYANEKIAHLIKNEERQRIARDLHDTLGHTLSMIAVKSELVERLISEHPEQAMEEAHSVQNISRTALLQVRELISDMQAIDIEEEIEHATDILQSKGIQFIQHGTIDNMTAAPIIRNILGMCLRECITNVVKHSHAKTCTLSLYEERGKYVLIVRDDGIGIAIDKNRLEQYGNGLFGMKERLLLIGGRLEVNSNVAHGTEITIHVPKVEKGEVR